MKQEIFDKQGKPLGELDRPEPIQVGKEWFEAGLFEKPKWGEFIVRVGTNFVDRAMVNTPECWIIHPIPTPPPDQLSVIGAKLASDRPTIVKEGDTFWTNEGYVGVASKDSESIGTYRWHLEAIPKDAQKVENSCLNCADLACREVVIRHKVRTTACGSWVAEYDGPVPPPPEDKGEHRSCEGCGLKTNVNLVHAAMSNEDWLNISVVCKNCFPWDDRDAIRKNYTPSTPPESFRDANGVAKPMSSDYFHGKTATPPEVTRNIVPNQLTPVSSGEGEAKQKLRDICATPPEVPDENGFIYFSDGRAKVEGDEFQEEDGSWIPSRRNVGDNTEMSLCYRRRVAPAKVNAPVKAETIAEMFNICPLTKDELCAAIEALAHSPGGSGWEARARPLAEKLNDIFKGKVTAKAQTTRVEPEERFTRAMSNVMEERKRQDDKWGVQNHTYEWWLAILMEEVGELAQAILETHFDNGTKLGGMDNIHKEAVQCAAVAVAMIESMDRLVDPHDGIKAVAGREGHVTLAPAGPRSSAPSGPVR